MTMPDVLTLEEVADYLRLPRETVERQAARGQIPGRRIEDTWRFLRAAIDEWLKSQDSRTILLQQAGALAEYDAYNQLIERLEILEDTRDALIIARASETAREFVSAEELLKQYERVHDSKKSLLQQAGTLAADESLSELRAAIYAERGRPEVEEDDGSSDETTRRNIS